MAEHKQGEMDISVQESTFNGFMSFVTKSVVVILVFLVFLALVNG
ncbi:aa3-type cytochrome c oxidase subunit IV [Vannielia litorea]|uniref:Aa3 type cytochrome c oxidase subunit IV n=1 Tax=Vannielia litorea TaxID=1217970 RepID=A0A1N6HPM1_9RHOB|nr:aa3-type cytochrome c oxidase subunit IV [Vannielia litorea]SIO21656.1 aa3 type cytochrome c oxidase subunit IV [Vannielia litorea]